MGSDGACFFVEFSVAYYTHFTIGDLLFYEHLQLEGS